MTSLQNQNRQGSRGGVEAASTLFKLVGICCLALGLAACRGNRSDKPPVHLIQNMDFQDYGEGQEHSKMFADGRVMRKPVDGTVARGFLKDDDHFYRGRDSKGRLVDSLPAGLRMKRMNKKNRKFLTRGRERYDIYCAPCHDQAGRGQGIVTKRGGGFQVQPVSFHQDKFRAMPLGHFFDVISNGKGTMLSYAAQIPERDRWAIAAWVRTLQVHGLKVNWEDGETAKETK